MQYLLLLYADESVLERSPADELRSLRGEYDALTRELRTRGKLVASNQLTRTSSATTVRVRDGDTLVSDGPFAETKESLGGYYLIEAGSLDEAIEWASRIPGARTGSIEIRPIHERPERGA